MRKPVLIVTWVAAAFLTSGIAWAALSSADRQVGDGVASPVLSVPPSVPESTSTSAAGSDDTTPTTSAPDPVSPSSSSTSSTSTSTTSPSTSTTSTSGGGSPAEGEEWDQTTVPSPGGVVLVGHRPGEVRLDSATPAPGFAMEIDKQGPDEVRVEFEGEDDSYEVRVRWHDGALRIDVDD